MVNLSGRITIPASPSAIPVPLRLQAYSPVSMAYREGVLVAAAEWAFVKRIPACARRSTLGVRIVHAPLQLKSP